VDVDSDEGVLVDGSVLSDSLWLTLLSLQHTIAQTSWIFTLRLCWASACTAAFEDVHGAPQPVLYLRDRMLPRCFVTAGF